MAVATKTTYTEEQKAAYRMEKKAEIEAVFQKIDEGVKQVFESNRYKNYLKFMSKFTD